MAPVRSERSPRSRAGIVAGALLGVLALGYAALHLPAARGLALRLILARLERAGISARADNLDYNLSTLRFHLSNLELRTTPPTREPFFTARDVRIRLAAAALLGRVVLREVEIDEPRLTLTTTADGAGNWPGATPGAASPSSTTVPRIVIDRARLGSLVLRWRDPQLYAEIAASLELSANAAGAAGRLVTTRPGRIEWRDRRTSVDSIDGRISWNGADLGLEKLTARLREGTVIADGRIDGVTVMPRADLHIVADADLAAIAPWLGAERRVAGVAHADAKLAGPFSDIDAVIALTGRDVSGAGMPPVSFETTGRLTRQAVEIQRFRGRVAGGTVAASGRTAFDGAGSLRAEWQDVDLVAALRGVMNAAPANGKERVGLSGVLSGMVAADWTAPRLERLQLAADARVANDGASARAGSVPVDGAATFALRGLEWELSTADAGTQGGRVSGRVGGSVDPHQLSRSTINGAIRLTAGDAGSLLTTLARAGLIETPARVRGRADGDFAVSGIVGGPSLDGPLSANVTYQSMPAARVRTRAHVAPDGARLQDIDVQFGASSAHGDAAWTSASGALSGRIDGSIALADLRGLSSSLSDRVPLDGRLGLSASLSGTPARARATLAASGTSLEIAGQRVDRSSAEVSADLASSRLVIDRVTVESGTGRIDGRGELDLKRRTYAAHLSARDVAVSPVIGVGDTDLPISGRLGGSFDGEGSFDDLGGRGDFSFAQAHWKDADLGAVNAGVTLEGRRAAVSLSAPDLALQATGSAGIDAQGPVAVRGDWTPRDIAPIVRRLAVTSTPVGGSATIRFELNGARDRLDALQGAVALDALNVTASGQTIRLSRPGRLEYDGRTARADNIALTAGSSTLVLDGSLGTASAPGLTASLDGSLADFALVRDLLGLESGPSPLPPPAGAVQLRLSASGALARPVVSGTYQVTGGRVPLTSQLSVTGVTVNGRLDSGVVTIESAAAEFAGATLKASARVPSDAIADRLPAWLRRRVTPAAGAATLSAQLLSVNAGVAAPFVDPQRLSQLGGQLDATVNLSADRLALDRLSGTITLDRSDLSLGGVAFNQQVPTRLALGGGRLTIEAWEWGRDDNRLVVRGGATLGANPSLNLVATSVLDLRILNILAPSLRIAGRADTEVRVGGSMQSPALDGWITFSNGEARIANPRLVVSDIQGTVTLAADTVTFQRLFASVNGGDSDIAGTIRHRWFRPLGGRVTMVSNGAALAIEGLRAEANMNLALEAEPARPLVTGTITLVRSAYREQLSLTSGLLRALQEPSVTTIPAPPSALDQLRLDVRLVTQDDLVVDNNYGKLSASADLRLVGTPARPSLTGRATLGEGGSIFFGTRRYRLDKDGTIDFASPTRIEPNLNLAAKTNVGGDEITLTIAGTPAALQTELMSRDHPEYTKSDLVALLLTGRTASDVASQSAAASGAQLLGLLSGEFLGTAGQALGLSTLRVENSTPDVRFDAGLVATETDPGARLTIGRNIGSQVEVVFSQSLQQSGELTWIVSYAPRTNFVLRAVSLDNGDRIYDFRHDLTFGRPANAVRPVQPPRERVASVQIAGAGADEAAVRSQLKLHEGARFSFFTWQDDRERIETYYHEHKRFEAHVLTKRMVDPADPLRISLTYDVRPGPLTTVQVEGFALPAAAIRDVERAWSSTAVDDLLGEEAVRVARTALVDQGYVQASVTPRLRKTDEEKQLTLRIETGTRAAGRQVRLSGNRAESTKRLLAVLGEPRLAHAVWIDPDAARDVLTAFYRANGFLNASVRVDPIVREGTTAIRPIGIEEGEPFRVRDIHVEGAHALSPETILAGAGLSRGEVLTQAKLEQARAALDQGYRTLGFNSVAVTLESTADPERASATVSVLVDEGRQQRLREVVTRGVEHTRPSLVSRALRLNVGQPVDLAAWNQSRRRLYETGAFRSVDIEREAVEEAQPESLGAGGAAVEPVRALVTVQEWPRYRFRYGFEVNDTATAAGEDASQIVPSFQEGGREFSLGATTDFAARNLFGRAVTAGIAARYTQDFRAVRTYATMPTFFGRRIVSNVFVERSNEGIGTTVTGIHPASSADITQFTFEQRVRPKPKVEIQYGYSIEQNHTRELHHLDPTTPAFDISVTKASLTSSIILDRRNDVFDASLGWFHASNVEYSPDWLSPDTRLARFSAEQRYYHRFGRVVVASWGRVGLATGFDQGVLPIDRFFAGGGNSVRGYAEEALSPVDFFGNIVGGNGLIVLNQEVRFPLFPYVRGVGFIDAGRAFETVGQMSLKDLSAGTGIGFRVQTPVVLLRLDMGVPLDASAGPRRPRWFFSIGQMF